jgi:hypothetical protein
MSLGALTSNIKRIKAMANDNATEDTVVYLGDVGVKDRRNRRKAMTIEVGHNGGNRRTQATMENQETSTRGIDEGQKLLSGTEEELIEDLQRVHKLCPNAEPDIDSYRAHGKFADAAWEEYFSRFNRFVGEAGMLLPRSRQVEYWANRLVEVLLQHREEISEPTKKLIRAQLGKAIESLKIDKPISETLANMEEEEIVEKSKHIVAAFHEEFGIQRSGNE